MPTDYVEDYEAVTGKQRETLADSVTVKVVAAPEQAVPEAATVAETK